MCWYRFATSADFRCHWFFLNFLVQSSADCFESSVAAKRSLRQRIRNNLVTFLLQKNNFFWRFS